MKKIILLTGARGAGKTTAGITYCRPSEMKNLLVVDSEDSSSDWYEKLNKAGNPFYLLRLHERYAGENVLTRMSRGELPWVNESQRTALATMWTWLLAELDRKVSPGKIKTIFFDTVEPLEAGAAAWSEAVGKKSGWGGDRSHGKFEVEAVRPLLEGLTESLYNRGVDTIIFSSHLKQKWENNRPVLNKVEPGGRLQLWARLSSIMLWLVRPARPTNETGAPSALVLKARDANIEVSDDDEWAVTCPVPPRVPAFTWKAWRQYEAAGWSPSNPQEGELLYHDEREMISEMLNNEQMKLMVLGAQMELEEQKQQQAPLLATSTPTQQAPTDAEMFDVCVALLNEHPDWTATEIAGHLGKPVPLVKKWMTINK